MEPSQVVAEVQHQQRVRNIKQINITVHLPFVMTFFEEQFSLLTIRNGGTFCFGEEKPETGNCLAVVDITPSQISYGPTDLNGTRCFSVSWWLPSPSPQSGNQGRVDCLLCQEGRLVFQFVKLSQGGVNLVDSLVPSGQGRNIKTNYSQIILSPLSSCSLPASCLSSPDCPGVSKLHNCTRSRCLSPSSPSTPCSPPVTKAPVIVVTGVLGLVTVATLLAVITVITRRLHLHQSCLSCLSSHHQGSHQQLNASQGTADTAL